MKKFTTTRDPYTSGKKYVWHNRACLGYFEMRVKENYNIDWPKYRADKSLKIDFKDRWYFQYKAIAYPYELCGVFEDEASAADAIIENHKNYYSILPIPILFVCSLNLLTHSLPSSPNFLFLNFARCVHHPTQFS